MVPRLNHTTVHARDEHRSAAFLADILGTATPSPLGPFVQVRLGNDATLDFLRTEGEIAAQHYAFLVDEDEFDQVHGRIRERGLAHWADPELSRLGEISVRPNGRGVHFLDPDGHVLEVVTRKD